MFLAGAGISLSTPFAGCLNKAGQENGNDPKTEDGNETKIPSEAEKGIEGHPSGYFVQAEKEDSKEIDTDTDDICKFEELPKDVQSEVERAVAEGGYKADESPEIVDQECYGSYIQYEGEYYRINVQTG